jgi:competence protein ComEC
MATDGGFRFDLKRSSAALIAGALAAIAWNGPLGAAIALNIALLFGLIALKFRQLWPLALMFGALMTAHALERALDQRLPADRVGEPISLDVLIVEPPKVDAMRARLTVQSALGRVHLSWYGAPAIHVGERWALQVKLKRPRGTHNPGLFDFEQYALRERINAVGYVSAGERLRVAGAARGWAQVRQSLSQRLAETLDGHTATRLIQALALGDQRAMTPADWRVLRATGTTHLFAISGFHIGMIALGVALILRALSRRFRWRTQSFAPKVGIAMVAVLAALGYGLLVGFEVPTARTCLVMGLGALLLLTRRAIEPLDSLAVVAVLVLLGDPLSVLKPGFWLSFGSVLGLLYAFVGHRRTRWWIALARAQWATTLLLLPLTLHFFGEFSWVSIPANFLAIPLISLVVVPLALIGTALAAVHSALGLVPLWLAATLMHGLMLALDGLAELARHGLTLFVFELSPFALALALIGALIALAPRALPGRAIGLLGLLALWPAARALDPGAWRMTVLDVGQGQAIVVETARHALLIDTGPAFGEDSNAGERIVVPWLQRAQLGQLDMLVVSHGDQDHAGGLAAVDADIDIDRRLSSDPKRAGKRCVAGQQWTWDQVQFRVLHPTPGLPYLKNLSSCVIRVDGPGGSALIPGDIEAVIEDRLVRDQATALHADVLVLPHHGSKSSSTPAFLAAIGARHALVSAGHGNRFGFPHAAVIARLPMPVINTGVSGQIDVLARPDQPIEIRTSRAADRAPWRE